MLSAAVVLPAAAHAQFSPQGLLNHISRPFRSLLGRFGHYPHHRQQAESIGRSPFDAGSPSVESRLGRVGPPAWPSAYEDLLGYVFWPDDYVDRLRRRGFDVIAETITGRLEAQRMPAQASTTGAAVRDDANVGSACHDTISAQDNWPAVRVSQTIQLTNVQHDAVDAIQKAVTESSKILKADCADPNVLAAPDRLRAVVQTLWTVRDAGTALRAPLKEFDTALTNAQKASFVSRAPRDPPKPDRKNQNSATNPQYQDCAARNVEEAERLIKEIELRVRPTKDQAASLANLHKVSSDMAKLLMTSCAQPIPSDPLARLDATIDQLTAMNYAAITVQIAFNDFYAKLDNAQKARFNTLGR